MVMILNMPIIIIIWMICGNQSNSDNKGNKGNAYIKNYSDGDDNVKSYDYDTNIYNEDVEDNDNAII